MFYCNLSEIQQQTKESRPTPRGQAQVLHQSQSDYYG